MESGDVGIDRDLPGRNQRRLRRVRLAKGHVTPGGWIGRWVRLSFGASVAVPCTVSIQPSFADTDHEILFSCRASLVRRLWTDPVSSSNCAIAAANRNVALLPTWSQHVRTRNLRSSRTDPFPRPLSPRAPPHPQRFAIMANLPQDPSSAIHPELVRPRHLRSVLRMRLANQIATAPARPPCIRARICAHAQG